MRTIYFLRGLPASGKTTWALAKLDQVNNGTRIAAIRVNKDEIRMLIGATDGSRENEVVLYEFRLVTNAAKKGVDIIVDDTNLYVASEQRFRKLAERLGYRFEMHSYTIPVPANVPKPLKNPGDHPYHWPQCSRTMANLPQFSQDDFDSGGGLPA